MERHRDDSPERRTGRTLGGEIAAHVEAIVHAAEREARAAEHAIADRRRSAEEEAARYLAAARLQVDAETAARAARLETLSAAARRLADELSDASSALTRELRRADADALPRPPWPAQEPAAHHPPAERPTTAEPDLAGGVPAAAGDHPSTADDDPSAGAFGAGPGHPAAADDDPSAGVFGAGPGHPAADDGGDAPAFAADPPAPAFTAGPTGAPAPPPPPAHEPTWARTEPAVDTGVPSAARLVAIEMAVGGSSRAEVAQHLRAQLEVAEPDALLDDVFGPASDAASRLAWGEP